jgi:hypothetical protein
LPLSLSILFVIIVVFVVINNGPNKTEDKENSSIRFKVKANVENRHYPDIQQLLHLIVHYQDP